MKSLYKFKRFILFILIISCLTVVSCEKFIEVEAPITSLTEENLYSKDATAPLVITGIIADLANNNILINQSAFAGLSADELTLYSAVSDPNWNAYYKNTLVSNRSLSYGVDSWRQLYFRIYRCNTVLESISRSSSLNPLLKERLIGEASFLRAFFYFYLVNMYGDVPLVLTTDYTINESMARTPANEVYQQIINDLKVAKSFLSDGYLDATVLNPSTERIRPNKWVAAALLARTYLYLKDWQNAEIESSAIIDNKNIYDTVSLKNVFIKASLGNKETIWQLQPVKTGRNTDEGWMFILPSTGPDAVVSSNGHPLYLSKSLLDSFENNDQRKTNWVSSVIVSGKTYSFPYKYKIATNNAPVTEFTMVFRLGEQYLIRSEARAQQNNISGSQADLNLIRNRARLGPVTVADKTSLLNAILHERQMELFTEWGHRWFDLQRMGKIDAVMTVVTPQKSGGIWQSHQQLYPIDWRDINTNPNLNQNPGYQ